MSYLGYTQLISHYANFLYKFKEAPITILEIGIDRGQTTIPFLHNLVASNTAFTYIGVDIREDGTVVEQLHQMDGVRSWPLVQQTPDSEQNPNFYYFIENSLDWLPQFTETNPEFKFDIVLLDGDHNYHTVTEELKYFNQLTSPHSLCVLDDYYGKYAHKDDYYADKPTHDGLNHKKISRDGAKQGMQLAVQDFLKENPHWQFHGKELHAGPDWEPVIITQELILKLNNNKISFSFRQDSKEDSNP